MTGTPLFARENTGAEDSVAVKETAPEIRMTTVTGRVRDAATKSPLPGAKVQSKDRLFSAMTDEEGRFSIQIPYYLNQLRVSAPDYSEREYPVHGESGMEASLYRYLPPLRNPSALTADGEIQSTPGGDVRVITRSGAPAIGASLFIRGYNSLNAGSQPLTVIDGAIFDNQYDRASIHDGFIPNPLSSISMDDIESIRILKDGTSLYGAKGGNGVLLIKTKRGKDPVTRITASMTAGYSERPRTMPLLDAGRFRVYVSDILKDAVSDPAYLSSLSFLNDNPSYYDYPRYHNNNDWNNDVSRSGTTQSFHVGVSGGDNVALYHLSMGYADAGSTLKANDFTRFNARFNADIDLSSKFGFAFDLSYSQTDRNLRDDGFSETSGLITAPSVLSLIKAPFLIPYEYSNSGRVTDALSDADFLSVANPVAIIENGIGESSQNYLSLSARPSFRFNDALKLSASFNYSLNSMFEKYFRPNAGVADVYMPDVDGYSYSFVKAQNAGQISLAADMQLNWNKRYAVHLFNLTGGARFLSDSYKGEYGSGHNTASDLDHNLNGSLAYRYTTGYDDRWRSFSWYALAEYSLYDKYSLEAALSADASSRFGKDADLPELGGVRWGIFP